MSKFNYDESAQGNWEAELNELLTVFHERAEESATIADEILTYVEDLVCNAYVRGKANAKKG